MIDDLIDKTIEVGTELFLLHKKSILLKREWLTLEETAFVLGVSMETIRRVRSPLIPIKLHNKSFYSVEEIQRLITKQDYDVAKYKRR